MLAARHAVLLAARSAERFFMRDAAARGRRRHARQDDVDRACSPGCCTRPAAIRASWSAAPAGTFGGNFRLGDGSVLRRRGRRVRHRVLRQGAEVSALRSRRAAADRGRVRPRRHLPRPRSREGRVSDAARAAAADGGGRGERRLSRRCARSSRRAAAHAIFFGNGAGRDVARRGRRATTARRRASRSSRPTAQRWPRRAAAARAR